MISEEALKKFRAIWMDEFGVSISDNEAVIRATELLTLADSVYRPIRKEWAKKYENEQVL